MVTMSCGGELHQATCDFAEVPCTHPDCEEMVLRKDLAEHESACGYALIPCSHEGCLEFIPRRGIEEHEATCRMRMSYLYGVPMIEWQKAFIEQQAGEVPEGFGADSIECDEPAAVAVRLVVEAVKKYAPPVAAAFNSEPLVQSCPACDRLYETSNLAGHLRRCDYINIDCEWCGNPVLQGGYEGHKKLYCEKCFADCPQGCGAAVAMKELNDHVAHSCVNREVVCSNEGCGQTFIAHQLEGHSVECSSRVVSCEVCSKEMKAVELQVHGTICHKTLYFDDRILERQLSDTVYPVYEAEEGKLIYLMVPAFFLKGDEWLRLGIIRLYQEAEVRATLRFGKHWDFYGTEMVRYSQKSGCCKLDCLNSDGTLLLSYECRFDDCKHMEVMGNHHPVCRLRRQAKGEWVYFRLRMIPKL